MKQAVYLIAVQNGAISVMNTPSGCVLPGGICDGPESHEAFLNRFCLENTGYEIGVEDFVCEHTEGDVKEYYYSGVLSEAVPGELHRLSDLPLTQLHRLRSASQRNAVEECLDMMRADAHGSDDEDL